MPLARARMCEACAHPIPPQNQAMHSPILARSWLDPVALRLSQRSLGVADRVNRGADGCSKSAQGSSSFGWSYQAGSHAFGDLELDPTPPTPSIADISGIRALPIEVVVDARCYPCRVESIPDHVAQF